MNCYKDIRCWSSQSEHENGTIFFLVEVHQFLTQSLSSSVKYLTFIGLVLHWQLITLFSNNCLKLGIPLYRLSKNPNLSVRYKYIKTCGKQTNSMYLELARTTTNYANVTRELLSNLRKNKTQTLTSMHGLHARRACVGCSLWVQSYNAPESRTYRGICKQNFLTSKSK